MVVNNFTKHGKMFNVNSTPAPISAVVPKFCQLVPQVWQNFSKSEQMSSQLGKVVKLGNLCETILACHLENQTGMVGPNNSYSVLVPNDNT